MLGLPQFPLSEDVFEISSDLERSYKRGQRPPGAKPMRIWIAAVMLTLAALWPAGAFCDTTDLEVPPAATPPQMRGRVSAVNSLFIGASNELGEFESGLTAQWLGAVRATIFGGIGSLMIAGLWSVFFPDLRRADALSSASLRRAKETAPEDAPLEAKAP